MPLRIAYPGVRLTLLEATGKKAAFLRELVDELSLEDVSVLQARAEDAGADPALRGRLTRCWARASPSWRRWPS